MNKAAFPPLLIPLIAIVAAIITATMPFYATCNEAILIVAVIIFALSAIASLLLIKFGRSVKGFFTKLFPVTALMSASYIVGLLAVDIATPIQFNEVPKKGEYLQGVVTETKIGDKGQTSIIIIDKPTECRIMAFFPFFTPEITPGDILSFTGTFSNQYSKRDTLQSREFLFRDRSLSLTCYVSKRDYHKIGHRSGFIYTLRQWRVTLMESIAALPVNDSTTAFLEAVLAGDDGFITQERRQSYSDAGISHILALSGAHVGILAFLVSLALYPLAIAGHRRLRGIVTLIVLWLFAIVTGLSASVVRSVIMASALIVALILDKPRDSINALCLAAIAILLFRPFVLLRPGFQLSFAATLGIILASPSLSPYINKMGNNHRYVVSAVLVTLSATLATMGLVAWHFHQIPLAFMLGNIVAVAFMPLIIVCGVIMLWLSPLGLPVGLPASIADFSVGVVDAVATNIAMVPGAVIRDVTFSAWLLISIYGAVASVFALLITKRKVYAVAAVLLVAFTYACYRLTS